MIPPNMPNRPSRIDGRRVDRQDSGLRQRLIAAVLILAAMTPGAVRPVHAADAAFTQFIASLWPEAQAAGVSRATFDAETRGLEPDYKLPDLLLPGRPATGAPSQAEFVQVPADYVKEASHRAAGGRGAEADAEASRGARPRSKSVSAFPPASCWRSGAARRTTAATGCLTTRCAWWRRRPMSAGARTSTAASSSWR